VLIPLSCLSKTLQNILAVYSVKVWLRTIPENLWCIKRERKVVLNFMFGWPCISNYICIIN
jgi:hypothetical protein